MTPIFEAVDSTNEETYWTLGVWSTLEDALAAFADAEQQPLGAMTMLSTTICAS